MLSICLRKAPHKKIPYESNLMQIYMVEKRAGKDAKLKNDKLPPGKSQFLICIGALALSLLRLTPAEECSR